ncbi:nucleoporin NSP1-like [Aquila chrysaetos chrysaetos]|uniref:nucleoporin NSP1-like n=1 Tax=Aquila chrysaetos chrysaetos TaxID=223781 RepID=UPI00117714FE|nr:nucleoporin NSP1-like [Aquila chrysaetos chrysaetos]
MADGEGRTDTAPTTPTWEGSSIGVLAGSEVTRPAFPTTSLDATAAGVGTASVSADSRPLRPSSAATSHSSSSPAGSSAAAPSPRPSSTSGTPEAGLAAASHSPTTLASSAPSSAPGATSVGSGAATAEAVTRSPAPSAPSPDPSAAASSVSPASGTAEASLSSALAGSVETQAARLTSGPRTRGQLAAVGTASNSTGSPSPAAGAASVASPATTPPGKGESPTANQGSGTTAEPDAKTSLSHPATLLVTQSMTDFRKSTSVNSSFTGTCLPVSIKVQNVTREAIQFSWTGGRRGSLYTVSLMDGNRKINKTTTKETKTVFNHLLPSHIYKISVAVLSCAENVWTSASVRTDPVSCFSRTEFCLPQNTGCPDLKYIVCSYYQAFACSVLLKSQTFNHTLYNSDSEGYKTMSESIKTEVSCCNLVIMNELRKVL